MMAMQQRAVAAVRDWNDRLGTDATYLICSHGDVIKAILADALGMHLDMSQRIQVDPCSLSIIRYTTLRPFVLRMNDTGADPAALAGAGAAPGEGRARRRMRRSAAGAGSAVVTGATDRGCAGSLTLGDVPPLAITGTRWQPAALRAASPAEQLRRGRIGVMPVYSYDPPERFVAGTVGQPGERTFYLQATVGTRVTSVALEKGQVEPARRAARGAAGRGGAPHRRRCRAGRRAEPSTTARSTCR